MPLVKIGWMDKRRGGYVLSLLGTSSVPEEAISTVTGGTATAGWRFNTDGTTDRRQTTWTTGYDDWATPSGGNPGDYFDIRATRQSGTETSLTTGNLNTWEALSTNRTYEIENTLQDNSTKNIVLKIEIRDKATLVVLDTGYYKLTATSNASGGGPGTPGEATP